ncbi:MAG: hypothetical protein VX341_07905 [Bdellovibrionota bacterium]|nr:hypothetical protein [Bdellovibrionota bacterium]
MKTLDILRQSHLALHLIPITIRELIGLGHSPANVYIFENDQYILSIKKGAFIDQKVLKEHIEKGHSSVFVKEEERQDLIDVQQEHLRVITRSFSMGDSKENARKQLNLLSLNLRYLFEEPTNDETLNLQHQSLKILFNFLYKNSKYHEEIFHQYIKQGHHYIFAQPFLSSLFLIGILKIAHVYSQKDVENLFIASYFKDIGMSAIPLEKYDQEELSIKDKQILSKHPETSVRILKGRIPLTPNYFDVIKYHHSFSLLKRDLGTQLSVSDNMRIIGFETVMVNICDIIAAMISPRPYREAESLYDALKLVRDIISPEYPNEFKIIVNYFRNFFTVEL